MANTLRFSIQSPDGVLPRMGIKAVDQALEALLQGRAGGVMLITRVSRSQHDRMADAIAAVVGAVHVNPDVEPSGPAAL